MSSSSSSQQSDVQNDIPNPEPIKRWRRKHYTGVGLPFSAYHEYQAKLQSQASGTQPSSSAESDVNMEMISLAPASPLPPEIFIAI